MRLLIALMLTMLTCLYVQSQETIVIPAGSNLMQVMTTARIYYYPNFVSGESFFKDGTTAKGRLNYNILNEEVEFISARGDTMAIAKEQMLNIKYLKIDTTSFYYDQGYLRKLKENKEGKLAARQYWVVVKRQKIGGYGEPISSTAAIFSSTFYHIFGTFTPNLVMQENITLANKSVYYFGDKYNLFLPANKKNLLKLFPHKKNELENYLKSKDIDFGKVEDLETLFDLL